MHCPRTFHALFTKTTRTLHAFYARVGAAIPLTGTVCLQIFRRRNLILVFQENPFSLNELIGYADLTVFHEIWSEHSIIDVEQNLVAAFNATGYANFSIVELDRSIKR